MIQKRIHVINNSLFWLPASKSRSSQVCVLISQPGVFNKLNYNIKIGWKEMNYDNM